VTVSVVNNVSTRPWRGYDDPGLPVGMWYSQNSVTGDASGGDMTVIFVFKGEAEPVSGRFYSLEQFECQHSEATTKGGGVQLTNFETLGPVGLVNRQWRFTVENNNNGVACLNNLIHVPLPLFMGSAAPVASLAAQLEVNLNNVDLTSFVVTVQGYIWEPRSIQAEGGLRRPVDSLYGGGRTA